MWIEPAQQKRVTTVFIPCEICSVSRLLSLDLCKNVLKERINLAIIKYYTMLLTGPLR
jgi:hypothetical protein